MGNRINDLMRDPTKVSDVIEAALIQATYEDDMAYSHEEGRKEGYREGRIEGRKEGIAENLINVLVGRFGELPEATLMLIKSSSIDALNDLARNFQAIQKEADIATYLKT